jgi:hypothetical protein
MIFTYGGYSHPDNECLVTFFGAQRLQGPRGKTITLRRTMRVEGEIIASTTAAIDARVAAIRAAYAVEGGSAVLYTSAGASTQFQLPSLGSISGTRIVEGPTFFTQDGKAHYATGLPFALTLEADYFTKESFGLLFYTETISRVGSGGPRRVVIEVDNGLPVEQLVSTNTPIVVIQSGEAVNFAGSYPPPNSPIFAQYLDEPDGNHVAYTAPRLNGETYTEWTTRWDYRFTLPSNTTIPYPRLIN